MECELLSLSRCRVDRLGISAVDSSERHLEMQGQSFNIEVEQPELHDLGLGLEWAGHRHEAAALVGHDA